MKQMLKETLVIFIITILAGAALGGVYTLTKEPIKVQNEIAKAKAYQSVFVDADYFAEELPFDSEHASMVLANIDPEHDNSGTTIDMFCAAYNGDELVGFVVTVTNHEGFGGDITFSMGVRLDGTLNGISITSIKETAGLGMRAQEVLAPQFEMKSTDARFMVTKTGAVYPSDIDAISSATITSKAVVSGVNTGITYCNYRLSQYQQGLTTIPARENGGDMDA